MAYSQDTEKKEQTDSPSGTPSQDPTIPDPNTPADDQQNEEIQDPGVPPPLKKREPIKRTWFKSIWIKYDPIKSNRTRMIHTHDGREFRGRPWWKFNQNPKTGELERTLVHDTKRKRSKVFKNKEQYKNFQVKRNG